VKPTSTVSSRKSDSDSASSSSKVFQRLNERKDIDIPSPVELSETPKMIFLALRNSDVSDLLKNGAKIFLCDKI
jgi:hypothetical protein